MNLHLNSKNKTLEVDLYTSDINSYLSLSKIVKIKKVVSDKILSLQFKKLLKKKKIKYLIIKNKNNFLKIKKKSLLGISFGFGVIFNKKFINDYKMGIWNIHPGDLPKYRGRHPISWAILKGEKKIFFSIHEINEKIDQGYLLSKVYIKRRLIDDEKIIFKKYFKILNKHFLKAYKNFISNNKIKLKKGNYYPPISGINIDNSKRFEKSFIKNAITSQKKYGGIIVNGKKYTQFSNSIKKNIINKKHNLIYCKNNKKIILF